MSTRRAFLTMTAAGLASTGYGLAGMAETDAQIRFGLTPVFLTSDLELLDRFQTYLQRATGFPVSLITRRTYQEITALLIAGQLRRSMDMRLPPCGPSF